MRAEPLVTFVQLSLILGHRFINGTVQLLPQELPTPCPLPLGKAVEGSSVRAVYPGLLLILFPKGRQESMMGVLGFHLGKTDRQKEIPQIHT